MAERLLRGYGRQGLRVIWPDNARLVINLVLNYEEGAEYTIGEGDGRQEGFTEYDTPPMPPQYRDLASESVYEYGSRAGVWRLARLFDRLQVPITVSACGLALQRNPEVCQWIVESGSDVMAHGWRWSELWRMTKAEELREIQRATDVIATLVGTRPLGWNSRYGPSENTRNLVMTEGYLYDSDAYNDDLPYWVGQGEHRHLVIPYTKTYNDSRFVLSQGFSAPQDFFHTCRAGMDYLLDEGAQFPKMMSIGVHARIMGQAARAAALRDFILYAQKTPGVRFMRRAEIAHWWVAHHTAFGSAT